MWDEGAGDLFGAPPPDVTGLVGNLTVPKAFLTLTQTAILHADSERFALLYTLLWRLQTNRALMEDHADPLVDRLEAMAKDVRRDIHKMRAFVRFRQVQVFDQLGTGITERYVAWFEPDNHIVRANAGFFARRFATMRWSILTPEVAIHWDDGVLTEGPGAQKSDAPEGDPIEDVWKTYYANIFNPARVKVGAMLREMPKKYWKNMPETALVPELLAAAQAREIAMVENSVEKSRTSIGGNAQVAWERLREEAMHCTRCDLYKCATQTVFGEGPVDAPLVMVGEQPGDQEDLAGHPFVGPAGQKLDEALADAGIDRTRAYVTNAVKHFKFEQRGKRRIHSKPGAGEIEACRWWIDQERAILTPQVTVALGATAARSLFGKVMTIGANRGRALELPGGGEAWITVHPSFLLRVDPAQQADEYARFVEDLKLVRDRLPA